MVEDRIIDGKRIAQLMASELTGLERGRLADVEVTDADPAVEPSESGALAFTIRYHGEPVGTVSVTPETARVTLPAEPETVPERDDVTVEYEAGESVLVAHSGAAVKAVVDVLLGTLD